MLLPLNKVNPSTWILYPMYNLSKDFDSFLYNTYIYHEDYLELVDHFYLLFKFSGRISNLFTNSAYIELENKLIQSEDYFFHYDINGGEYVLFCLKVPDTYLEDYKVFMDGKYSKIKKKVEDYPNRETPLFHLINTRYNDKELRMILNKDKKFKKMMEDTRDITIPDNAEVYTSVQDEIIKEDETFRESKIPVKVL